MTIIIIIIAALILAYNEWRSVSCEAFDVISGSFELLFFLYKGSCSQNVSFSVANNKFQFTVTKQTT